jgi:hypothetical protein
MIFRQLLEPGSSTYTYLLGCPDTLEAVLIDPVMEMLERDLAVLSALDLRLACTIETHTKRFSPCPMNTRVSRTRLQSAPRLDSRPRARPQSTPWGR